MPDHANASPDLSAARDDVLRARGQISETIAEIEARVTAPVRAVKERLDVGRVIAEHPWASLSTAVAVGVAVAASQADRRAAAVAADAARAGVQKAREGGVAGVRMAREVPSKSRTALAALVDGIGARIAASLIAALRESGAASAAREPRTGLGFVHHDAPAHESEQEPRPLG